MTIITLCVTLMLLIIAVVDSFLPPCVLANVYNSDISKYIFYPSNDTEIWYETSVWVRVITILTIFMGAVFLKSGFPIDGNPFSCIFYNNEEIQHTNSLKDEVQSDEGSKERVDLGKRGIKH